MSFLKNLFGSKQDTPKAEVLLEVPSPACPITAIVEQDERVAYFYLWGPEQSSFGVKSCWVRNLTEAPNKADVRGMKRGVPPMLPKANCLFPAGQDRLNPEHLEVIWLEEGDAAALLEAGEIIAILPSWGGHGGFHGYARDCKGEGDFAWELKEGNDMIQRIVKAAQFWGSWDDEVNPFQRRQPELLDQYKEFFGDSERYFAIDNEEGAPIGLYVRDGDARTVFATVGLSIAPMPQVEMYTENRFDWNRIELGMMLKADLSEHEIQHVAEWISGACAIPWGNITFLGEGHTTGFSAFKNSRMNSVLLTERSAFFSKVELGSYRESSIKFLWMIPITENERQLAIDEGSETLLEKLNGTGSDILSIHRDEVV